MKFGIPVNENPLVGYGTCGSRPLATRLWSVLRAGFVFRGFTKARESDRGTSNKKERAATILCAFILFKKVGQVAAKLVTAKTKDLTCAGAMT